MIIRLVIIKVKYNSMKKNSIITIFLLIPMFLFSQETLTGMIMDKNNPKDNLGVFGANVYWLNSSIGATTNEKGWFTIPYKKSYKKLVVSYVGYKIDTLTITNLEPIHHFITPENELEEVTINSKKKATQRSFVQTQNVFTVNSAELLKAACSRQATTNEPTRKPHFHGLSSVTETQIFSVCNIRGKHRRQVRSSQSWSSQGHGNVITGEKREGHERRLTPWSCRP